MTGSPWLKNCCCAWLLACGVAWVAQGGGWPLYLDDRTFDGDASVEVEFDPSVLPPDLQRDLDFPYLPGIERDATSSDPPVSTEDASCPPDDITGEAPAACPPETPWEDAGLPG